MTGGVRGGWQTTLADLSLILFMVSVAALDRDAQPPTTIAPLARVEPVAIYRPDPDAPSLREWLAQLAADDRQRLTIVARYTSGGMHDAIDRATALAEESAQTGVPARIVVERARANDLHVTVAYDGGAGWHRDCIGQDIPGAQRATGKDVPCE